MVKKNKTNLEKLVRHLKKIEAPGLEYFIENIIPEYYPRIKDLSMIHIADSVFSDFVRIMDANKYGMVQCVTCGVRVFREYGQKINNGHYKYRNSYKYRFSRTNCHPQCYVCNVTHSGNYRNYHIYMVDTYGEETERRIREDNELVKLYDYDLVMQCVDRHHKIVEKKLIIQQNNPDKLFIKP